MMQSVRVHIGSCIIVSHYLYKGYKIINHGYYPPDRHIWWEAVNLTTGEADYHAYTKGQLQELIDQGCTLLVPKP